jgi:FkbM family methyltransferase
MIRTRIRSLIREATGYDLHKAEPKSLGQDAHEDIAGAIGTRSPIIFDVGANVGQTIEHLLTLFPPPEIHAFEPDQVAFTQLSERYASQNRVSLNNIALGATTERRIFFENTGSDMSSFLSLGVDGWGSIKAEREVEVGTVDNYCSQHDIGRIDLLKSDTQGSDLDVVRGAKRMIDERRVHLLYLEITFAKLYEGLPRMDVVCGYIADQGFELVSFYKFHYLNGRAGWTDALFIHPEFNG